MTMQLLVREQEEAYWNEFYLSDGLGINRLEELNKWQRESYKVSELYHSYFVGCLWEEYETFANDVLRHEDGMTVKQMKKFWDRHLMVPVKEAWSAFKKQVNQVLQLPEGKELQLLPGEDDKHPLGFPKKASDAVHDSMKATLHLITKHYYHENFLDILTARKGTIDKLPQEGESGRIDPDHFADLIEDEDLRDHDVFFEEFKADAAALEEYNENYTWSPQV